MQSAYELYNNQVGVRLKYIVSDIDKRHEQSPALLSYSAYEKRANRNSGFRLRTARGAGNDVLLSWDHLPQTWKQELIERFGDPLAEAKKSLFEKLYCRDAKAAEFYSNYYIDGERLDKKFIEAYTTNASVLNAVIAAMAKRRSFCKALGGSPTGLWEKVGEQLEAFREKTGHTIKIPSLRRTVSAYKKLGYEALISRKLGNQNTAKLKEGDHIALIEELLKKHTNLDNHQIQSLYNTVADKVGWKTISASTVANYRKELDLFTYAGRRGETSHRNSRAMQVKRKAPNIPMIYWTIDGWDAELLYQKTETNAKGHSVITYHNRLTAVVVLDPFLKYPVGYAIGTHETPELIKAALRNAVNHTKELFGKRYKTLQLQSDHYGKGVLVPVYEALTTHYTPARVKNAKSKLIEREFLDYNKTLQLYCKNWSGYGITSKKENQPNADYLNKIRHQFPDEQGCREQIINLIEAKRLAKREEYVSKWHQMADTDYVPLTDAEYLNLFGETTGFTNRLEPNGLNPTILGEKRCYDSFDINFRTHRHIDWLVKYDPEDLSQVLAVNAEARNGRLIREINTVSFLLEAKHIQPMALYDRQDGDAAALQRVNDYNKQLEQTIIERGTENRRRLDELFVTNPQLNDTLTKLVLTDSAGQHKNHKNAGKTPVKQIEDTTSYEIIEEDIRRNY